MTVSSSNNRNTYSGNGVTTVFPYSFKILDDDDIKVIWQDKTTGTQTTKTKTTHYTVSNVGEDAGGNVTFTGGNTPPSTVYIVLIRNMDFLQETDYTEYDAFPAESHETALDKLTMEAQQLKEISDRTLKIDQVSADAGASAELPGLIGKGEMLLRVKPSEDGIEYINGVALGIVSIADGIQVGKDSVLIEREIKGTTNQITVTNGTGVSGNPTISLPSTINAAGKTITGATITGATINNAYITGSTSILNTSTINDSLDATKKIKFVINNISTSTQRDITIQNASGTMAYIGNKISDFASCTISEFNAKISDGNFITTSSKISDLASTTSSELASKISDKVGTGSLVFNTNAVLNSPHISGNLEDANGNEMFSFSPAPSAVNYLQISNAASGQDCSIWAGGSANAGLSLITSGTGVVEIRGSASHSGELRFREDPGGGTNHIGLKAPASVTSNAVFTLPSSLPSSDDSPLVCSTSGSMYFGTPPIISTGPFSATSIGITATKLQLNTATISNPSITVDTSNDKLVVAVAGIYEISFYVSSGTVAGDRGMRAYIYVEGSPAAHTWNFSTSWGLTAVVSRIISLSVNDEIEFYALTAPSGESLEVGTGSMWSIKKIG